VLIADGPLVGRIATITEVNDDTAIVTLTVFDRTVQLEMSLSQLLPPPYSGGGIRDS
jgi:transcription antitermination factor NusG